MTKNLTLLLFLLSNCILGQQQEKSTTSSYFIITPEIMAGITAEPNTDFPEHGFQKQLFFNFGWEHKYNPQEWAFRLKGPRTGINIGYSDFGNAKNLGAAITVMPNIEFNIFKSKKLKMQIGAGISYFTKKYDSISNPNNQAVTTNLTFTVRAFTHYQISSSEKIDWRLGLGYFHHSNGHTRLPNQGYNTFLASISADIKNPSKLEEAKSKFSNHAYSKSVYDYLSIRSGYGRNVLSKSFNDNKDIYTISAEYGKVFNNTLKIGIGFYYRFYKNYYDYIKNDESLVQDGREFDYFKEKPRWYASNLGLSIKGEILLNHIGIDLQFGINLHKPAYKIDWRINQGWSYVPRIIPEQSGIVLGELNSKFKLKQLISPRLGLKYYLIGTTKNPKSNIYIGAYINANLGQADFTELSLGYVYSFKLRKRK